MRFLLLAFFVTLSFANDAFKEIEGEYNYEAAQQKCNSIGNGWRVPEIWELFILRGQVQNYGLDKTFYSATEVKAKNGKSNQAFVFYLQDGDLHPIPKTLKQKLICTNSKPILQTDEFFTKTPKSVRDFLNDILWEPMNEDNLKIKKPYSKADAYCRAKDLYGRSWRLPTLEELYSIVNYDHVRPSVNQNIFFKMKKRSYWTQKEFKDNEAYVVDFNMGSVKSQEKTDKAYIRCVSDRKNQP